MGISGALIGAGATLIAADMTSNAASDAADTQAAAANAAANLERKTAQEQLALQKQIYEEGVQRQEPYYQAGKQALARLQAGIRPGGEFTKQFGNIIDDPSYQFRLQQGQRALEASAAAKGQLFTAGQQQALQAYGQNTASTEYANAYDRFMKERQTQLANVSGLATTGSQTASGLGQLGQQYASQSGQTASTSTGNINDLLTSGAAAQAAGEIGTANAWGRGISTGVGLYNQYSTMQQLQGLGGTQNYTQVPYVAPTVVANPFV